LIGGPFDDDDGRGVPENETQLLSKSGRYGCMTLDHERLDVYHLALDLLVFATGIIEVLPRGRGHLADPFTRASMSVVLNIAEGAGKTSKPEPRAATASSCTCRRTIRRPHRTHRRPHGNRSRGAQQIPLTTESSRNAGHGHGREERGERDLGTPSTLRASGA